MSKEEEKDVRRTYLLRVASHILGLNIVEEKLRHLQPIETFCDTNATLLTIALTEQRGVDLSNTMKSGTLPRVVFYKSRPTPLTNENYKAMVNVMSMNGASNEVFLKSVQNVTEQYNEAFEPLQIIIDTIEDREIDELIGLVEAFEDTCDALWNSQPPYPETRMRSLIQCMESYLCEQITAKIDETKLWKDSEAVEKLNAGISACAQWDLSVQLMTGQTWKRQVEDTWKGDPVDMKYLQGFKKRLGEVLSLKQLGPQIALLLNERGVEAEVEKTIETAMRNTAVTEKALDPIIERTLPVLKSRLQPNKLENNHLTADLEKYKNFLCRAKIKEKLQSEREALLTQLSTKLVDKEREIDNRMSTYSEQGRFLTEIAAKVVWIRQQSNKLENLKSLCSALLDDLTGYPTLNTRMTSFMDKLKQAEQESYDQW
ncbi:unnamed protein product [Heligmosomoides polygyrus]|uniref:Cytoplasmic dynein 2 heavy chain 1 n=1 Tax=Heligmosomoides polygyrus TaxID=6339 RepID=A0A3P8DD36_HELPZ|nr:unnamed protein product [Heligmosomoides polygyrus]